MQEEALRDYNEKIIYQLNKLNKILRKILEDIQNGKKCPSTYNS